MKYSITAITLFLVHSLSGFASASDCAPDALEYHESIGMTVEKVGQIPTVISFPYSYNMMPMDNFVGDTMYFLEQQFGKIYSYSQTTSEVKKRFDMDNAKSIPAGLTLNWEYPGAAQTFKVKSMTQGKNKNFVYVVFTSSTLPDGWNAPDTGLPPPGTYSQWVCGNDKNQSTFVRDIYRPGTIPACAMNGAGAPAFTAYDVFYRYSVTPKGKLRKPKAFFVHEHSVNPGHLGGGITTVDNGKILYSTGDCTFFGLDGSYPPQLDFEACGKILLIDPSEKGKYDIVAKGVRNSQQMRVYSEADRYANGKKRDILAFMDIGGVTAEEVNAFPLNRIVNSKKIDNFGWGRNLADGHAREGIFYVEPGSGLVLGGNPACKERAPTPEPGFIQPWIQFGRTATDYFYAISSFAVPSKGLDKLQLIWSEFNTGKILATEEKYKQGSSASKGYKIQVFDSDGVLLVNGLNDLVVREIESPGFTTRGDPRLFHYPDGHAGVFIERTGVFYKLTERTISEAPKVDDD